MKLRLAHFRALITTTLTLAYGAAAMAQTAPAPATATAVLIENVRIFDGKSAKLSAPSNVLVLGNKISQISVAPIALPTGATFTTIKGAGRTLMPGLIDNHVHVNMSASTLGELMDPAVPLEAITAKGSAEAGEMLLRGFTAVRDLGGPVFDLKRMIDQGKTPGPRIYPSGAIISQTSGHGDNRHPAERSRRFGGTASRAELMNSSYIADGRDEVLTATRENLRGGASQIKIMAGGGAATMYDPLDVTQYTLDEMKAAVEAAEDWGTYVTVHAYTPRAVRRAIDAGVKCIEHGQMLDEATVKLLAQKNIWLSLQVLDPAPPQADPNVRIKKQQVVDGTDNAYRWAKKHKVKLAWGTDFLFNSAQNKNQNSDMLKLKTWFTPAEILKMVTHDNAQLLALSGPRNSYPGKLGVVEAGALADLLLVNGDPLANIDLLADPGKNFAVIMKDGQLFKNQTP
ncbi:metal-dependent hydrolase family protein [Roseateles albus]|uniref:Amidohydrolase family protein n=1 Tax=Roseateles albus TaxID=2987525 RepID=A0ABT5KHU7_9BURK|nr:amidohydrolase family protein [Roseateles albus]MDC8773503.1 amidohydrolase family protein [Roseateles albus]